MQYQKAFNILLSFLLCMSYCVVNTAAGQQECATDFYSQSTCESFDKQYTAKEHNLWPTNFRLSGSQIWHRKAMDNVWFSSPRYDGSTLENQAIHRLRCIADLFGVIVCDQANATKN